MCYPVSYSFHSVPLWLWNRVFWQRFIGSGSLQSWEGGRGKKRSSLKEKGLVLQGKAHFYQVHLSIPAQGLAGHLEEAHSHLCVSELNYKGWSNG